MPTQLGDGPLHLEALPPGTCLGRWRVVEQLGVGGQGAVYRVEDMERPGDFYALKLALHARHARTEREGELMLGRAVHPHVVRLHGCARWPHPREGCLGLLMDWVPGLSLDAWAESPGTTFRALVRLCATVARTLGELHARGVLHRDLKPEHIVVRAADGEPMLLDFGAGWYEGAAPLTTGPLPPATRYLLSPEAVRFLWQGARHPGAHYPFAPTDDLYALGVCLYRATTGHYPFFEWLPPDLLQSLIVHAKPPAPACVNPRVPSALSELIMRLLAKEPRKRYPSGEALHGALAAVAGDASGDWDADIFEYEDAPPLRKGEAAERHLIRPRMPSPPWSTSMPPEQEMRWGHWAQRLALAATLLWALVPGTHDASRSWVEKDWTTDARAGSFIVAGEAEPIPVKNQKQTPCTAKLEVERSGVCWHLLRQRPPDCPTQTASYKDECLWPVPKPPLPNSLEGGAHGTQ